MGQHKDGQPHALVLNGEPVIFFTNQTQVYNKEELKTARPAWGQVDVLYYNDQQPHETTSEGKYTIHNGEFKFHYKKTLYQAAGTDEDEPRFSGEHFVDHNFVNRVNHTRIIF